MIEGSSLDTKSFGSTYSLFSNYAHSEYLSLLQIQESKFNYSNKEIRSFINYSLSTVKMLHCQLIFHLTARYKSAEILFNAVNSDLQRTINFWSKIATKNQIN